MSWDNIYVLALAVLTIVLLATERAHLSTLGIGLIIAVAVPGLISAEQAISGLASPSLVTIAALFVVGEAFLRTGAAQIVADNVLHRTGRSEPAVVLLIMVMAAVLSAFVNNTLVIVTFLPVVTTICRETGIYPSRLLIPLSYASILGGMCTLVGTSTNLLVSGALQQHGEPPLAMFTMSPAGLILAGVGILYLALFGRRLLPSVPSLSTQMAAGSQAEYVMEITVGPGSPLIGQPADQAGRQRGQADANTMMVVRGETLLWPPFSRLEVREGDILMLGGPIQTLTQLQKSESRASADTSDSYDPSSMSFFELALGLTSSWVGRTVGEVQLKAEYGAVVVAVQRSGRHIRERVSSMTLQGGDVLLVFGDERSKAFLRNSRDFHVIEGVQEAIHDTEKAPWAFGIVLGVVALFVTGIVHYSTAALLGALAMTLTGCLSIHDIHSAVKWPIILFIAGMLALSSALGATGTTGLIADTLQANMPPDGGMWLLIGTFIATVILTEFLTNNAVAVLLTPLVVEVAHQAHLDPVPLVMAVALGASSCFANPMGYQTNLMVMGPGGYRFRHFIKVGAPLDLLLIATGIVIVPWFWPLQPAQPKTHWHTAAGAELPQLKARVAPGTNVRLTVSLPQAMHVFVVQRAGDESVSLFPGSSDEDTALAAGEHILSGPRGWPPLGGQERTEFLVVISRQPRPGLLAALLDSGPRGPPPAELEAAAAVRSFDWGHSVVPWPGAEDMFVSRLRLTVR